MLTAAEVEQFVEVGFVRVERALSPSSTQAVVDRLWERLDGERDDARTWKRPIQSPRIAVSECDLPALYSGHLREALDQLLGRGGWQDGGGSFECVFPGFESGPSRAPTGGWHVDASGEAPRRLDTPAPAVLLLLCFSDIGPGDGGTALRPRSHRRVGTLLEHGPEEGLRYGILHERLQHIQDWEDEARELEARAGDAYLCHGLLLHSRFPNTHPHQVRLLANRCIALRAPPRLSGEIGQATTPFERSLISIRTATAAAPRRAPAPPPSREAESRRRQDPVSRREGVLVVSSPRREASWVVPDVGIELGWVEPGQFLMGSPADERGREENEAQHLVTLSSGFWCGLYPVTQEQWCRLERHNPSRFVNARGPVESVSWHQCQWFCHALTDAQRAAGWLPEGHEYRLLTESEWEYVARAGSCLAHPKSLDDHAWHFENSQERTHDVGLKRPNAWGFHDFHGLVWEWCRDRYAPYPTSPTIDPLGGHDNRGRMYRGGSWLSHRRFCRSASRGRFSPEYADEVIGFRVALAPSRRLF